MTTKRKIINLSITVALVLAFSICFMSAVFAQGKPKFDSIKFSNGIELDTVEVTKEEWPIVIFDVYQDGGVLSDQRRKAETVISITHKEQAFFGQADDAFFKQMYAQALGLYKEAAANPAFSKPERNWGKQYSLFKQAECYRMMLDHKNAVASYEALFKDFPRTFWLPRARMGLLYSQGLGGIDKGALNNLRAIADDETSGTDKFPMRFRVEAAVMHLEALAQNKKTLGQATERANGLLNGRIFELDNQDFKPFISKIEMIRIETLVKTKKFSAALVAADKVVLEKASDEILATAYLVRARCKFHASKPDVVGVFWDGFRAYLQFENAPRDVRARGLFYAIQVLKLKKNLPEKILLNSRSLIAAFVKDYADLENMINKEEAAFGEN